MNTAPKVSDHNAEYDALIKALTSAAGDGPKIKAKIGDAICRVEWGHPTVGDWDDEKIEAAEQTIYDRSAFKNIEGDKSPFDRHLAKESIGEHIVEPLLRKNVLVPLKEGVEMFGLTDVAYYCSQDGERAVRSHGLMVTGALMAAT